MSKLYVNEIAPKSGNDVTVTGLVHRPAGSIIEVLTGVCNGGSQTVQSGTYTFPDVTAVQILNTSYADVTGSNISYTPPTGTTRVKYELEMKIKAQGYSGISHYRFYIDGVEVTAARSTRAHTYSSSNQGCLVQSFSWIIDCNASSASAADGTFTSWTTAKALKWQARNYDTGYLMRLHLNNWWDGGSATGTTNIDVPKLTITSYA